MAVVEELLRSEADGTISFGNHVLEEKAKKIDFEHCGDLYKVKTFKTMTRLSKNGMFVYGSVPGTSVAHFKETAEEISFRVSGSEDAQITLELNEDTEYEVFVDDKSIGKMKTNLGGKLNIGVELAETQEVSVRITK